MASGIDANYERKQDERQTFAALTVDEVVRKSKRKPYRRRAASDTILKFTEDACL